MREDSSDAGPSKRKRESSDAGGPSKRRFDPSKISQDRSPALEKAQVSKRKRKLPDVGGPLEIKRQSTSRVESFGQNSEEVQQLFQGIEMESMPEVFQHATDILESQLNHANAEKGKSKGVQNITKIWIKKIKDLETAKNDIKNIDRIFTKKQDWEQVFHEKMRESIGHDKNAALYAVDAIKKALERQEQQRFFSNTLRELLSNCMEDVCKDATDFLLQKISSIQEAESSSGRRLRSKDNDMNMLESAKDQITHLNDLFRERGNWEKSLHEIMQKSVNNDNNSDSYAIDAIKEAISNRFRQHQELQTQHQELQTQHQELQTQHQELQTQHQELQTQVDALYTANEATLSKWKPMLRPEVENAYVDLKRLNDDAKRIDSNVSGDEYIESIEKVLSFLSKETLDWFKERNVKFVGDSNPKVFYPKLTQTGSGELELRFAIPYKYAIPGMILRIFDARLEGEYMLNNHNPPDPETRAKVAATMFLANAKLGKHAFPIAGYEQARRYHLDFDKGIEKAIKYGKLSQEVLGAKQEKALKYGTLSQDASEEAIIKTGHNYALKQLIESIKPIETKNGPCKNFPNMRPGAYFEEIWYWELHKGQYPVKVNQDSKDFKELMVKLKRRKEKGKNYTLTVNILANQDIWVQPYFITSKFQSQHPIDANGMPSFWAGEVEIVDGKVVRMKDQSGHYKTFDRDSQEATAAFAVEAFEKQGFDVQGLKLEHTDSASGGRQLKYRLEPPDGGNAATSSSEALAEGSRQTY